jgi:hypothetical protein
VAEFVEHDNTVRLHSAIGYVTPQAKLEGRAEQIWQDRDAELEQQMRRMMDDVIKDIREAVAAKGKAGGYAYVVDTSSESLSKAPIFLYSSGESDLTPVVIEQLNAAAPPEPVASEKPADKKEKKP